MTKAAPRLCESKYHVCLAYHCPRVGSPSKQTLRQRFAYKQFTGESLELSPMEEWGKQDQADGEVKLQCSSHKRVVPN